MNSLSKGPSSASTLVKMKLSSHWTWAHMGRRRSWKRRWYRRWSLAASMVCRLCPHRWGQHHKTISPCFLLYWAVSVWQTQEMPFGAGQAWGLLASLPGVVRRYPLGFTTPSSRDFMGLGDHSLSTAGLSAGLETEVPQLLEPPPPPPTTAPLGLGSGEGEKVQKEWV